jgi:hypothetical protein
MPLDYDYCLKITSFPINLIKIPSLTHENRSHSSNTRTQNGNRVNSSTTSGGSRRSSRSRSSSILSLSLGSNSLDSIASVDIELVTSARDIVVIVLLNDESRLRGSESLEGNRVHLEAGDVDVGAVLGVVDLGLGTGILGDLGDELSLLGTAAGSAEVRDLLGVLGEGREVVTEDTEVGLGPGIY